MKTQDNLRAYMKELPKDEPSADFTKMVMNRVRLEAIKSPILYPPLISRKMWLNIFGVALLFVAGVVMLRSWFPSNDTPAIFSSINKVDFSFLLHPFQLLSDSLNKLSLAVVGGILVISLLVIADQFHAKYSGR